VFIFCFTESVATCDVPVEYSIVSTRLIFFMFNYAIMSLPSCAVNYLIFFCLLPEFRYMDCISFFKSLIWRRHWLSLHFIGPYIFKKCNWPASEGYCFTWSDPWAYLHIHFASQKVVRRRLKPCLRHMISVDGSVGLTEIAGVDIDGGNCRGGHCRSGHWRRKLHWSSAIAKLLIVLQS